MLDRFLNKNQQKNVAAYSVWNRPIIRSPDAARSHHKMYNYITQFAWPANIIIYHVHQSRHSSPSAVNSEWPQDRLIRRHRCTLAGTYWLAPINYNTTARISTLPPANATVVSRTVAMSCYLIVSYFWYCVKPVSRLHEVLIIIIM